MSDFMQPQIFYDTWVLVDGNYGIETVPADLDPIYDLPMNEWLDVEHDENIGVPTLLLELKDYIESKPEDVRKLMVTEGYGARLSAPGFMDCTAWTVFKTREEAEEFLRGEYDVEEEETEEE